MQKCRMRPGSCSTYSSPVSFYAGPNIFASFINKNQLRREQQQLCESLTFLSPLCLSHLVSFLLCPIRSLSLSLPPPLPVLSLSLSLLCQRKSSEWEEGEENIAESFTKQNQDRGEKGPGRAEGILKRGTAWLFAGLFNCLTLCCSGYSPQIHASVHRLYG